MKKLLIINILFISLFTVSCESTAKGVNNDITNQYYTEISDGIQDTMENLCSEDMLGRVVGTKENLKAAKYIKDCFENLGIESFDNDDYYNSTSLRYGNDIEVNNVAAVIKGKSSDKAVFITAHFDHVYGNDQARLQGAIDNASGVAVMLETANKINQLTADKPLDMDVVFVAFNSEETGLNGSNEFLRKYSDYYNEYYNINIDCVGMAGADYLAMGNRDEKSQRLYDAMRKCFDEEGIKYNDKLYATKNGVQRGTSDQQIFRNTGVPALVLGDDGIIDVVHTPLDNIDNIDYSDLEILTKGLSRFVIENNGEMFI